MNNKILSLQTNQALKSKNRWYFKNFLGKLETTSNKIHIFKLKKRIFLLLQFYFIFVIFKKKIEEFIEMKPFCWEVLIYKHKSAKKKLIKVFNGKIQLNLNGKIIKKKNRSINSLKTLIKFAFDLNDAATRTAYTQHKVFKQGSLKLYPSLKP